MEKTAKVPKEEGSENDAKGKPVKISMAHHRMLSSDRDEINSDKRFEKKISLGRFVEKLIEDYRKLCIPDLKKEREGSEDWLKLEHLSKAPDIPFFDWLKGEYDRHSKRGKSGSSTPVVTVKHEAGGL